MAPLGALLLCLMFGGLAWIRLGEPLAPGTAPFSDEELAACLADRALPVRSDTNCVVEPVDLLVCE